MRTTNKGVQSIQPNILATRPEKRAEDIRRGKW
jgi:hypothetical protein